MTPAMSVPERLRAALHFQPFDRLPLIEWATWWDETLARWHGEGLPRSADPTAFFGLDALWQCWIPVRDADRLPQPAFHGAPVLSGMDDYLRHRPHFLHFDGPLAWDDAWWADRMARQREGEGAVWFTLEGFFWFARTLLGIEPHLYAFYDEPELLHRINADLAEFHLRVIERIRPHGTPVFMTFAEDMSYNHGPMLSEELFDEFMLPYYRKVIPALEELGVVPIIDSDGDIARALPWFARAGLAGILPLERQAGVDVAALRAAHPRQRFIGAYDKMVMPRGEAAMREEFERLLPTMRLGGFVPSVDHQTPPGVSLEQYRVYVSLAREYAARAAGNG